MSTRTFSISRPDTALAILRVTTGAIFAAHGAQKLFVFGFAGVTGAFTQMGVPMPGITGPLTALVEFFGGLALIAGLLTQLAAFGLSITMLGAISFVHLAAGFFGPKGMEFPLALLGSNITLVLIGAGRYSIDAVIARVRKTSAATAIAARNLAKAA